MKKIELKKIDQTIYTEVLDNGLTIYMLPNKNVENFYISFVARYGSIDTEFKIDDKEYKVSNGIAHFLEHVNFNISEGVTAHELFKKLGSYINAFTSFRYTLYLVNSNEKFEENTNLLLDYVQKGYFTEKIINKEKGIIVEEVRRTKNNLNSKLYYESKKALYKNNKMDIMIVGEEDDVRGITLDEVKLVHEAFYNPSNTFIVITGNFDIDEAVKIIKKNQAGKKFKKMNVEKIHKKEPIAVENKLVVVKEEMVEIPKARVSYKLDRECYKDYDDEELLNYCYMILSNNFSSNSELYEELIEKNMISRMYYSYQIIDNILELNVEIESNCINEVIEKVREKMKKLEITEDALIRKKRVNIANLINQYDDVEDVNRDIAWYLIFYNKIYDNLYDIYNDVTLKKAKDVIRKMNLDNESVVIMER